MVSLAQIIKHLYPTSRPVVDWVVESDQNGEVIKAWHLGGAAPSASDIANATPAAQAALDAEAADQTAYLLDRGDLKAQFSTAAARLAQIRDAASPTNAQVIAAVRDLAAYQLKILKYIRKL